MLNELVSKYIVINHEGNKIKHLEEDQVIDIDLKLPKITIKYQNEQGETLKDSVVKLGKVSDSLSIEPPYIEGYGYINNIDGNVNFMNEDQEIILIYNKITEGVINIRYVTEDGEEIALSESISGKIGTEYMTNFKEIPGYELLKEPKNKNGIYQEEHTVVTYVYKKIKM